MHEINLKQEAFKQLLSSTPGIKKLMKWFDHEEFSQERILTSLKDRGTIDYITSVTLSSEVSKYSWNGPFSDPQGKRFVFVKMES